MKGWGTSGTFVGVETTGTGTRLGSSIDTDTDELRGVEGKRLPDMVKIVLPERFRFSSASDVVFVVDLSLGSHSKGVFGRRVRDDGTDSGGSPTPPRPSLKTSFP